MIDWGMLALLVAKTQIGVMEEPPGSNRGERVDLYNRAAGTFVDGVPGAAWCLSFVFWCFAEAARGRGLNPMPRTAYCPFLYDWARARAKLVSTPCAGDVFLLGRPSRPSHAGFVSGLRGDWVETVEGNTNVEGQAEGIGVFFRHRPVSGMWLVRL